MKGTAKVVEGATVEMQTDGPCLEGTLQLLETGVAARPMPKASLVKVRQDALNLLSKVLPAYEGQVAQGEVGANGSAVASAEPASVKPPTGLLYGRVQSGKTVAMIAFCAAAIDNGFRVIVVLTSDFVKLVEQTADRFAALDGPLIKNALQSDEWDADREHVRKHIGKHGVVFICTKNQQRLTSLVDFLQTVGASDYPAIVLDDEADQATLDTTVQARSSGRKNAPLQASAIHRKTVQDDEGQSIRQTLRHHVFIQVTATPYALLLQNIDSELRPSFTHLLEPGPGYTGGEAFFDVAQVERDEPPLVTVDEDESAAIDSLPPESLPPLGLQKAIAFFLVAAGAQNVMDAATRSSSQNFLCHTSQKTSDHSHVAMLIRNLLNQYGEELERDGRRSETHMRLSWAYEELRKTLTEAPEFSAVVEMIRKRLPRRDIPIVNSAMSRVEFGRQLNFIVGGNILGRGLTIDNLLVTYYLRRAKVSQMDTVLQHARMFGYRAPLMPYTRVFLPESLAARFHFIHVAEQRLRQQLGTGEGRTRVTVEAMSRLRATRLNVLDTNSLAAFEPGHHLYPGAAGFERRHFERGNQLKTFLTRVMGNQLRDRVAQTVSMDDLIALLKEAPYNEDQANMWDPDLLSRLLKNIAPRYESHGIVIYRTMRRTKRQLPTGALSGDELAAAREAKKPVLFMFRDDGRALKEPTESEYWYPSLVLPADMPTQVFNTTQ
jgi:hypothetical protein